MMNRENILIEFLVKYLKHGVVLGLRIACLLKIFHALDAFDSHGLGDLNRICAPWCYHFFSWPDEKTGQGFIGQRFCSAKKPDQLLYVLRRKRVSSSNPVNEAGFSAKE